MAFSEGWEKVLASPLVGPGRRRRFGWKRSGGESSASCSSFSVGRYFSFSWHRGLRRFAAAGKGSRPARGRLALPLRLLPVARGRSSRGWCSCCLGGRYRAVGCLQRTYFCWIWTAGGGVWVCVTRREAFFRKRGLWRRRGGGIKGTRLFVDCVDWNAINSAWGEKNGKEKRT